MIDFSKQKPSFFVKAMIDGLKEPKVEVRMNTFGLKINDVCFGCAATCALFKITGKTEFKNKIEDREDREKEYGIEHSLLYELESAFDTLRQGALDGFEYHLSRIGRLTNKESVIILSYEGILPTLTSYSYDSNLQHYEEYYKYLLKHEL